MASKGPFSKEVIDAFNEVVALQLHISHVYVAMAYNFMVNKKMPTFASFFEREADTRRNNAEELLKFLWKHKGKLCPPIHEMPDMTDITSPKTAIKLAWEMEEKLTQLLLELKDRISTVPDKDLVSLFTSLIQNQTKNQRYLKYQVGYQERLRKQKQAQTENPCTSSGEGV